MRLLYLFLIFILFSANSREFKKISTPQVKDFVYIPSGTLYQSEEIHYNGDTGINYFKDFKIGAFWISETEVSIKRYKFFLKALLDSGRHDDYRIAYPDTSLERTQSELISRNSFRSKILADKYFENFPINNISIEAAELYCKWLTEQYKTRSEGFPTPVFRIPTRREWIYASRGGNNRRNYGFAINTLRNNKGYYQCSFRNVQQENLFRDRFTPPYLEYRDYYKELDNVSYLNTAYKFKMKDFNVTGSIVPVYFFSPNEYGVYNMTGNLEELIKDSIPQILLNKDVFYYKYGSIGGSFNTFGGDLFVDKSVKPLLNEWLPSDFLGLRPVANYESKTIEWNSDMKNRYAKMKKHIKEFEKMQSYE
ncbi:hypothetical protein EON78_00615 [bacterium]|nr:MAG: hypothetical protein EON78_00615 [bacterium]